MRNILGIVTVFIGGPVARAVCAARRRHDDVTLHDGSKLCRRCYATTPSRLVM